MAWSDPNVPLPDANAKFELNVHSNDCYTAGGPSKYVGQLTITDQHGHDVSNPVFEFDFAKPMLGVKTPTQLAAASAVLTLPAGTMARDRTGAITPTLNCSVGKDGCAGTLSASAAGKTVTTTYAVATDDPSADHAGAPSGHHRSLDVEGRTGHPNRAHADFDTDPRTVTDMAATSSLSPPKPRTSRQIGSGR